MIKATIRTNKLMNELLKMKYINYDTKVPNYVQVIKYLEENNIIKSNSIRKYRAEHDTHNSSGKIRVKTTRSNEVKIILNFNDGKHSTFDSDDFYGSMSKAIIEYLITHKKDILK